MGGREIPESWREAMAAQDWDGVEEIWLEALEQRPIPVEDLLELRRLLWKAGRKKLALTLLELLADAVEEGTSADEALVALRELVRLNDRPEPELLQRLEAAFKRVWNQTPSLDPVLEKYNLSNSKKPLGALDAMEGWVRHDVGAPVEVRGQGVGRVVELNLALENVKVDLGGARPVSVPFGAVERYLRVLPEGSFLRRKVEDPDTLRRMVVEDQGGSLVLLLEGRNEPATVAEIKADLDGILPMDRWTSWWAAARKHPRVVSQGTGSRLKYSVTASEADALEAELAELRAALPQSRLALARRLAQRGPEGVEAALPEIEAMLEAGNAGSPGLAWEASLTFDALGGPRDRAEAARRDLLTGFPPQELLGTIDDRGARQKLLETVRSHDPDGWPAVWTSWFLHEEHPSLLQVIADSLDQAGHADPLDGALEVVFRDPTTHPHQFVWACEAMTEEHAPSVLEDRMTPSILERLPDTLTRKEFSPLRARAKELLEGGRVAVRLILERATPQQGQRFADRLSRIDSLEPERLRLIEQAVRQRGGAQSTDRVEEPALVASHGAVETKQAELKQLLEVEIPKTLKGIQAAAAEGDLRENFEYHMLRDRQELLSARAAKLQRELSEVRIIEPGSAETSSVNLGTVVHLEADGGSPIEPVTILGPWDADLDRRIFAAGSGLARGLLGKKVGDSVEVEGQPARITRIEPWGQPV
jgi:transcription elongation factor GreA